MRLQTFSLNGVSKFYTWGPFSLSLANLIMIGLIFLLFTLAILLPFPKGKGK